MWKTRGGGVVLLEHPINPILHNDRVKNANNSEKNFFINHLKMCITHYTIHLTKRQYFRGVFSTKGLEKFYIIWYNKYRR